MTLAALGLSKRARQLLAYAGIRTAGALRRLPANDISMMRGEDAGLYHEVSNALTRLDAMITVRRKTDAHTDDTHHADFKALGLSAWTRNALLRAGVKSVERLRQLSDADLQDSSRFPGLGSTAVSEILKARRQTPGGGRLEQQTAAAVQPNPGVEASVAKSPPTQPWKHTTPQVPEESVPLPEQSLAILRLSGGPLRALQQHGITSVERLIQLTRADLRLIPGLGSISVDRILWALDRRGLRLRRAGGKNDRRESNTQGARPAPPSRSIVETGAAGQATSQSLATLGLSNRTLKALAQKGIHRVEQLCSLSLTDVQAISNLGRLSVGELQRALRRRGLNLAAEGVSQEPEGPNAATPSIRSDGDWAQRQLDDIGLTVRSVNALRHAGVLTLAQLDTLSTEELFRVRNLGAKCVNEITARLTAIREDPQGFASVSEPLGEQERSTIPPAPEFVVPEDWKQRAIGELALSVRASNALARGRIATVGELGLLTTKDLMRLRNLGRSTVHEIATALDRLGEVGSEEMAEEPPNKVVAQHPQADSLQGWLDMALQRLDARQRQIVLLRTGMLDGRNRTLEQVGYAVGISRERVRQIEKEALRRLKHHRKRHMAGLGQLFATLMPMLGGVATVTEVASALGERYQCSPTNSKVTDDVDNIGEYAETNIVDVVAFATFSVPLYGGLVSWGDDCWALPEADQGFHRRIEKVAVNILREAGHPLLTTELQQRVEAHPIVGEAPQWPSVLACVRISSRLSLRNGWYFLPEWSGKAERSAWLLAALQHIGRPAHFTRVAAALPEIAPALGAIGQRSIYASLSQMPQVERTGAGTFALKVWETQGRVDDTPAPRRTRAFEVNDSVEDILELLFPSGKD